MRSYHGREHEIIRALFLGEGGGGKAVSESWYLLEVWVARNKSRNM